ncbi:phosphonate transport system permease protein [Virgibacillus natechei]|uniref:Phosphonate transport system permease protein n=1 Tax=Virgibacillus natechei TaxID=1216297 RepID=A0ABS4IC47_9BACI|nr:phosphonate ABC transporter, permease protein PhnE [Virgibacillus natechei]MBP1968509.1 phosphonate transport system permease protein [Virgibacillus natechei]UZD13625.1 phosphonate ABC transporter, permease protein PhnE [Virgibacillus natechei]
MSIPLERVKFLPFNQREKQYAELKRRQRKLLKNRLMIWLIIAGLVIWSWIGTSFSMVALFSGATNITAFIFQDLLPPDFSTIGSFVSPALETLYMSYIGLIFSLVFSIFFGFMAAKNTTIHPIAAVISRSFIALLRSIPAIVWGILLVAAIGLGPLAGTLALGLAGIGILGKAFSDLLEEIDHHQVDAVRATGASWLQIMGQGVWPQFKPGFVSWSLYKMDLNIREAAVLGVVGAGGIGYTLESSINLFQYRQTTVGILFIFVLILIVEFTTAKIRERIL